MVTIEKPTPIRSNPMPTVQRRSKPVNGRSFALAAFVVGVLVVLVEGDTELAGLLASFDGDVPLAGVTAGVVAGVVAGGVVVVVGVGGFWA
jgi:hypothetical protein